LYSSTNEGGQMGRERSKYFEMRTGYNILLGKPKGRYDFGHISGVGGQYSK
jgi:hypothetical protein